MSDIVEILRSIRIDAERGTLIKSKYLGDAADEIENLRAALRRIRDEYWPVMDDVKYQSRDLCVAIEEAKEALADET